MHRPDAEAGSPPPFLKKQLLLFFSAAVDQYACVHVRERERERERWLCEGTREGARPKDISLREVQRGRGSFNYGRDPTTWHIAVARRIQELYQPWYLELHMSAAPKSLKSSGTLENMRDFKPCGLPNLRLQYTCMLLELFIVVIIVHLWAYYRHGTKPSLQSVGPSFPLFLVTICQLANHVKST